MPTKKNSSVSKSRVTRPKTSPKKKTSGFNLKKLLSIKLFLVVFAFSCLMLGGVYMLKKKGVNSLDTLPLDTTTGYVGGALDFDKIKSTGCHTLADTDSKKAPCYEASYKSKVLNKYLGFPGGVSADSFYSDVAYKIMNRYLDYYQNTNYGDWRKVAAGDNHYFRTVCQNSVVRSVWYKNLKQDSLLNNNSTAPVARITSVWNDFTTIAGTNQAGWGNPSNPGSWLSSAVGIPCLTAASLVWDKLPDAKTRSDIRTKAKTLAAFINSNYGTVQMADKNYAKFDAEGDSVAEEAISHGVYLLLYSKLSGDYSYYDQGLWLVTFASSGCSNRKWCALDSDFTMPNHNMWPNPQYGYSVLQYAFYSALPYYLFGGNTVSAVPVPMRLLGYNGQNTYNPENILESNARWTNFYNGSHSGKFNSPKTGIAYDYSKTNYLNQTGVTDWGFSAFNRTGALAFMYMNNPGNGFGWRYYDSPYAWHMTYLLNNRWGSAFIYPNYNGSSWTYDTLSAAKTAYANAPLRMNGVSTDPKLVEVPINTDQKINLNFFQNSIVGFDNALAFMFHTRQNYFKYINN